MRKAIFLIAFIFIFPSYAIASSQSCEDLYSKIEGYKSDKFGKKYERYTEVIWIYQQVLNCESAKNQDIDRKTTELKSMKGELSRLQSAYNNAVTEANNAATDYIATVGNPRVIGTMREEEKQRITEANRTKSASRDEALDILNKFKSQNNVDGEDTINKRIEKLKSEQEEISLRMENRRGEMPIKLESPVKGECKMSDDDNKKTLAECKRMAIANARINAAEKIGVKIEGITTVTDLEKVEDLIKIHIKGKMLYEEQINTNTAWSYPPNEYKYVFEAKYIFDGNQLIEPEKPKEEPGGPPPPPSKPFSWKRGLGAMVFHGGERNEFQWFPAIAFVGSVGSYFYFDSQYKENWSKYESSSNSSDRRAFYDKASQSHNNKQFSLYAGIGIWTLNVIYSFIQDNKDWGEPIKFSPITTYIIPQSDGGMVLFSYSF